MLGTGARYAEYGITGGFFLFTQALVFGLAYPDILVWGADGFGALLSATIGKIPPEARTAIQSLLVALALLSVFIIGLVLEIIGSVFMLYEAYVFRKYLITNHWLAKFVEAELPHYAEDYRLFLDLADLWSQWKKSMKSFSSLKSFFHSYFGQLKWQRQVQQRFRRLESVLIARVLTSGAKTEMLAEQISICRMSRAIGTALYVVACESFLIFTQTLDEKSPSEFWVAWTLATTMLIIVCATLIALGAYSRFANMLLSLVYASWKPQTAPQQEVGG